MKITLKVHIAVINPQYKTKQYYKKCVTQKTFGEKHKALIYYLMVLYFKLVRGQYLYNKTKRRGFSFNYLFYSFLTSFRSRPEKILTVNQL